MKVALFSSTKYDEDSFNEANKRNGNKLEIKYLSSSLNASTAAVARGYDAVCIFVNDDGNENVLKELSQVGMKILALRCAGTNNVDSKAAESLGIKVLNVPSYSPHAVAEFAVGMILTVCRKYHRAYNRVREGNFMLTGLVGFNLHGKTVGIVGTGRIGLLTGKILSQGFGCNVIAYDLYPNEAAATEHGLAYVKTLEELLSQSDIVSLHCPLSDSTKHLIDEKSLSQMKQGAILINTSRGGLIDTKALIKTLKSGRLGAVGLDVYEGEKDYFFQDSSAKILQDDDLARLISFFNVFISGHQAFLTDEALYNIADTTVKNLLDSGKTS